MNNETLFLYLNKELNESEQKDVEIWIEKNPEQFRAIKIIWENSHSDTSAYIPDKNKMWKNVLFEIQQKNHTKSIRNLAVYKLLFKYAAVFLLCLSLISYYAHKKMTQIEWVEYTPSVNKTEEVILPDGSSVTLNKESKLSYKKQIHSENREVILIGEAFFRVKKNPKKPFIITANNTLVKVLGTSFNINASDPSGNVLVSVKSGKVMFCKKEDAENSVYLKAGEMGVFIADKQNVKKTEIQDSNYLAWKTGILIFKNNTMTEVCTTLSKYYNIHITINNSDLASKKLTALFQNKSLEEVLDLLTITLDIKYLQTDDEIVLSNN